MCGIYGYIQNVPFLDGEGCSKSSEIEDLFWKTKHRGPDWSRMEYLNDGRMIFGFHRLAINDTSNNGMQPFVTDDFVFLCNGEIYNSDKLRTTYLQEIVPNSESDCEIVPHMIMKYGLSHTLELINGEFAFIFYNRVDDTLFIATDHMGIRPIFYMVREDGSVMIASEMKSMGLGGGFRGECTPIRVEPGTYIEIKRMDSGIVMDTRSSYYKLPRSSQTWDSENYGLYLSTIREAFMESVRVRLEYVDNPDMIGFCLSGGLDSSLVVAAAREILGDHATLKTFSIGLKNSSDLSAAKEVAAIFKTEHHECVINIDDMVSVVDKVIYTIESFDTTTIRASVPHYLLAHFIKKECPDIKVVLTGEGSDENYKMGMVSCENSSGGYRYLKLAPNKEALEEESYKLLNEIYMFDVTRCDRCISSAGLEARVPFLDKCFLNTVMRLPSYDGENTFKGIEKKALRDAFSGIGLPEWLLYRPKDAFSDSVGKEWVDTLVKTYKLSTTDIPSYPNTTPEPLTSEQCYYRACFERMFGVGAACIIPHYWMPNMLWGNTNKPINDPSARFIE